MSTLGWAATLSFLGLGVQPPNWNDEVVDEVKVGSTEQFQSESQMQPSFYDGPDDPPYVWW